MKFDGDLVDIGGGGIARRGGSPCGKPFLMHIAAFFDQRLF